MLAACPAHHWWHTICTGIRVDIGRKSGYTEVLSIGLHLLRQPGIRGWNRRQQALVHTIRKGVRQKMKIRPLGDKVLVKRLEAEEKTAGGIVLPDTAKEKPKQGKVVSVGNGKLLDNGTRSAMQVKKGDKVLFTSYSGSEVKISGEEYLIMDESEIMAIVED
jgi:chaperonin GroES